MACSHREDRIESRMFHQVSLRDVANWQLKNPADVLGENKPLVFIPRLQRGLVWNSSRMEILWDSLMRGIPVGTFLLSPATNAENQIKDEGVDLSGNSDCYLLLDGQQRSNAITAGFRPYPPTEKDERLPILWLDLDPKEIKNKRQKFVPKITTIAHPWGYANITQNETGVNTLPHSEQKKAVDEIKWDGKARPKPKDLWPTYSTLPIPMCFLLDSNICDEQTFWLGVLQKVKSVKSHWADKFGEDLEKFISSLEMDKKRSKIYQAVKLINEARIFAQCAPVEEDDNDDVENIENSNIATLFERINTQGVQPSAEELFYSSLKAILPELWEIETVANGRMFPARMASLAVRVFLSNREHRWCNSVSINRIRKIAVDNGERTLLRNFIVGKDAEFKKICEKVDQWFGLADNNDHKKSWALLPFHRTSVAQHAAEIYQLLLLLALNDDGSLEPKKMAGLITILNWFSLDKKAVSKTIFSSVKVDNGEVLFEKIKNGIARSIYNRVGHKKHKGCSTLLLPPLPEQFPETHKSFLDWMDNPASYKKVINYIKYGFGGPGNELLLYSVREYMLEMFPEYDPSQKDMWDSHNRPWDNDHILPSSWVYRQQNVDQNVRKLLYSMGNIAPISFSDNRSKNNSAPTQDYAKGHQKELLIDAEAIVRFNDKSVVRTGKSEHFINTTLYRMKQIYSKWFYDLEINSLLGGFPSNIPSEIRLRNELIESIKSKFPESVIHFVEGGHEFELINLGNQYYWAKEWISIGWIIDDSYLCVCSNGKQVEVGLRKHPTQNSVKKATCEQIKKEKEQWIEDKGYQVVNRDWWYFVRETSIDNVSSKAIIDEMKTLKNMLYEKVSLNT